MIMNVKYNGWTNYETWLWKLWIDNDQGRQSLWIERAAEVLQEAEPEWDWQTPLDAAVHCLAEDLRNEADDMQEETVTFTGPLSDLLSSALSRVEWREIAEALLDEVDELAA